MTNYTKKLYGTEFPPVEKDYCVDLWGSKPFTNDDAWTGREFDTKEEALAFFHSEEWKKIPGCSTCTEYLVIDGPDIYEERKVEPVRDYCDDEDDWRRERAMQAGMCFGIGAHNEYMGWD